MSTLQGVFSQFRADNGLSFNVIRFLFFSNGIQNADIPSLGAALDAIGYTTKYEGTIVWIADPKTMSKAVLDEAVQLQITTGFNISSGALTPTLVDPASQPLLPLVGGDKTKESLYLCTPKVPGDEGQRSPISVHASRMPEGDNSNAIWLQSSQAFVALGIEGAAEDSKTCISSLYYPAIIIPLGGKTPGALCLTGAWEAAMSEVGPAFSYSLSTSDTQASTKYPPSPLVFPLLDRQDSWSGQIVTVQIWPLAPTDPTHTYLQFYEYPGNGAPSPTFDSAFRTCLDEKIQLTIQRGGASRLQFDTRFASDGSGDKQLYLTVSGNFSMGVGTGSSGGELLCGLSGVETIEFAQGDMLTFYPQQPAEATVEIDPSKPEHEHLAFSSPTESPGTYTTSWAMILPGDPKTPSTRTYYSEPNEAPFFCADKAQTSDKNDLIYFPLSLNALPNTVDTTKPHYCFPIVPYRAMVPVASGFGAEAKYINALEFQCLNPKRQVNIEAMSTTTSLHKAGNLYAVTPQGHQATIANGLWTEMQLAQMSPGTDDKETSIQFRFSSGDRSKALPEPFQKAFLTNQQFLVITRGDAVKDEPFQTQSGAYGTLASQIDMDGWPFTLNLAANTSVGNFSNVLIFKSGTFSLAQMARHPDLWTQRETFTHTSGDPDGLFLSTWLTNYFEEAKQLYDNGNGIKSLANFCSLIDDENWNGFIALKVDVVATSLPTPIKALMAGIDKNLFYGHHVGNAINHVTASGTNECYALNSAMFGLVHYIDPELGAEAKNLPAYISSPSDYQFKVLVLEAVFEKAVLQTFSSKSMLLINKLFGDKVQRMSPDGTKYGTNNLELIGSYHKIDGVPSYTFSTASGTIQDFYPASAAFARNEITQATMSVASVSQSATKIVFNLQGNLEFLADPTFDLLSYQYLPYRGLALELVQPATGGDPAFVFDTSALVLAQNPSKLWVSGGTSSGAPKDSAFNLVRDGSLLSQLPLKLKGLISGDQNHLPKDLGYRPLETTLPSGISLPGPTGDWYALEFDMDLGGQGAMGSNHGISASLLLAWTPGDGTGSVAASPEFKLSGPDGVGLSVSLEGVVKFGAKNIVLNKVDAEGTGSPNTFVIEFESIALTLLSLSFPPEGTTNVTLFGDTSASNGGAVVKPTLGWFGGYVDKAAGGGS
ncbi:MAG: hypothetical protein KTR23_03245 [Rhodospirillales bacterium]|nr:hypothetical protein [Rhodospirillales bacterium]